MSSSQCEYNKRKKGQESLKEIGRWRRLLEACLLDDPVLHLKIQKSEKDIICYTHNRGAEVPSLPVSCGLTEWVCRPWFFSNIWKVVLIKKGEVRHPKRRYKRSNDKLKNMEGGKGKKGSMKLAPHRHPSCLYWHYVQKPLFQALTDRINQPTVLMSHLTVPPTMPRNSSWEPTWTPPWNEPSSVGQLGAQTHNPTLPCIRSYSCYLWGPGGWRYNPCWEKEGPYVDIEAPSAGTPHSSPWDFLLSSVPGHSFPLDTWVPFPALERIALN